MIAKALLLRAGAALGVMAFAAALGAWAGHEWATTQAAAERERASAQALRQYRAAVADGEAAAGALREQLALQSRYHATLMERTRDERPLVLVAQRACPAVAGAGLVLDAGRAAAPADGAGAGGGADAGGGGSSAPAQPPAAPRLAQEQPREAVADLELTAGAVSLWNSALAGRDVPAGACRAADPADPACAAGAGLTLAAAWRNHVANAAACAADRARHQHLIDYLRRREPQEVAAARTHEPDRIQ